MRWSRTTLSMVLLLLSALPLFAREAPTITSISPSSLHAWSGEWFMTIEGTHFLPLGGVSVIFNGPAGTISIGPSTGTDTRMYVWLPLNVLNYPGNYSVTVRVPNGAGTLDSNPAALHVIGSTVLLQIPDIVLVEATSLQGAIGNFEVTATSAYGQDTYIECDHKSGELFPFDSTTVTCSATDDFGGAARGTFNIQVADTTPPAIDVPRDLLAFGTPEGANAKWDARAVDVVDPEVTVTCSPQSGSLFRLGTSSVTCTSSDRFKNTNVVTFRVHAGDDDTPALVVPESVIADAASIDGSAVSYETSATDVKGNSVPVECDPKPGSLFAIGTTTVKCVALNATELFNVTVADLTPPQLFLPREVTAQAAIVDGAIVSYDASAKDTIDGATDVACYPASGSLFAPGQTTVNCSTSDKARNTSSGTFVVTVIPPVDDSEYLGRVVSDR